MNMNHIITTSGLSLELGVSQATASKILKGVGGGTKIGNLTIYPRDLVQAHLLDKNAKLLKFLDIAASTNPNPDACDCVYYHDCQKGE